MCLCAYWYILFVCKHLLGTTCITSLSISLSLSQKQETVTVCLHIFLYYIAFPPTWKRSTHTGSNVVAVLLVSCNLDYSDLPIKQMQL